MNIVLVQGDLVLLRGLGLSGRSKVPLCLRNQPLYPHFLCKHIVINFVPVRRRKSTFLLEALISTLLFLLNLLHQQDNLLESMLGHLPVLLEVLIQKLKSLSQIFNV